jgi:hypothetical protein
MKVASLLTGIAMVGLVTVGNVSLQPFNSGPDRTEIR